MPDYDTMPAGREMDVLVAEKVMGWKRVLSEDDPAGWCWLAPHGSTRASTTEMMPRYSEDITAALQVIEKMCDESDTVPLAICRAALRAVDHA